MEGDEGDENEAYSKLLGRQMATRRRGDITPKEIKEMLCTLFFTPLLRSINF